MIRIKQKTQEKLNFELTCESLVQRCWQGDPKVGVKSPQTSSQPSHVGLQFPDPSVHKHHGLIDPGGARVVPTLKERKKLFFVSINTLS